MSSEHIEWSPAMEIGHTAIDRQHKRLFDLAATLVKDGSQPRVMQVLASLSEYVIGHFRDEEELLEKIGYPGLAAHKKLHDEFRSYLAKLYGNAGRMTLDQIAEAVRLLVNDWLAKHILVADQDYIKYLPQKAAGDAPPG